MGWRLQMALRHGGVSVQEMADELGMNRNSLSRWLNDRAVPRRVIVKQWALRTGVPYEWIATGRVDESPRPGDPDGGGVRHQGLEPRTRWFGVSDLGAARTARRAPAAREELAA